MTQEEYLARSVLRFFSKCKQVGDCLEWTDYKNKKGYGQFRFGQKKVYANRFALMIKLGRDLLPGMHALHDCDNPPCVRADHLYEGTNFDNQRDAVSRGRHYMANRTHCPKNHEYNDINTYRYPDGRRRCRMCAKLDTRRRRAKAA